MTGLRNILVFFMTMTFTNMNCHIASLYLPKLAGRYSKKASFKKSWVRFRSCVKPSGSLGEAERKEIRTYQEKTEEKTKTLRVSLKGPTGLKHWQSSYNNPAEKETTAGSSQMTHVVRTHTNTHKVKQAFLSAVICVVWSSSVSGMSSCWQEKQQSDDLHLMLQ